ncbi:hypothetical protein HPB48_006645 [Haemaphysalis longicornis]|uniref:Sulfotransferase domain-containing protein n=1 Tax=Haemaphysalis longicornis TaxID=44386 RepID=A0A9J6GSC6_HAELO|nr:hypothetical protein HPB48_006645 [Haemaphysalis longicornis]
MMQRRRPAYQVIDGIPRCVAADPDSLRKALKFRAGAGDVVQSTYPKSGTNWVQYITQLILQDGETVPSFEEYSSNYRPLEYLNFEDWKSPLPLRTFLTHLPLSSYEITEQGKYIYVARNPWDVCVSLFHMVTNLSHYKFQDATFGQFVDAFLAGDFGYGDYFEHVASGFALRNEPNVFFVTYEQLKMDTRGMVLRLANFLGEPYRKALEEDEGLLEKLLERSTPDYMRSVVVFDLAGNSKTEFDKMLSRWRTTCKEGYEGDENKYALVRKAKVGGWKEYFTPELLRQMEVKIRQAEKTYSFMELWADIREEAIQASQSDTAGP